MQISLFRFAALLSLLGAATAQSCREIHPQLTECGEECCSYESTASDDGLQLVGQVFARFVKLLGGTPSSKRPNLVAAQAVLTRGIRTSKEIIGKTLKECPRCTKELKEKAKEALVEEVCNVVGCNGYEPQEQDWLEACTGTTESTAEGKCEKLQTVLKEYESTTSTTVCSNVVSWMLNSDRYARPLYLRCADRRAGSTCDVVCTNGAGIASVPCTSDGVWDTSALSICRTCPSSTPKTCSPLSGGSYSRDGVAIARVVGSCSGTECEAQCLLNPDVKFALVCDCSRGTYTAPSSAQNKCDGCPNPKKCSTSPHWKVDGDIVTGSSSCKYNSPGDKCTIPCKDSTTKFTASCSCSGVWYGSPSKCVASSSTSSKSGCFGADSSVRLLNSNATVLMSSLKIGDYISTGQGGFEPVLMLPPHFDGKSFDDSNTKGDLLKISLSSGKDLILSDGHYVYAKEPQAVRADSLQVGGYLRADGSGFVKIAQISRVHVEGLYLPLVPSCTLEVSGVIADCSSDTTLRSWQIRSLMFPLHILFKLLPLSLYVIAHDAIVFVVIKSSNGLLLAVGLVLACMLSIIAQKARDKPKRY